ncbi:hypothetical protein STCU_12361 [Strigomonas culicis]|uniref:Uncharacterized protein n=1 Tax=Strigomonas culicis TaxID=28005 RepID=S9TDQ0_9TRYP|nr:hypothetical protein STCU_12361 [Strigomonas culicis]|eukprot:EPY15074.1 hypothetical protein STCU_12361 [Strigomonas culicis]
MTVETSNRYIFLLPFLLRLSHFSQLHFYKFFFFSFVKHTIYRSRVIQFTCTSMADLPVPTAEVIPLHRFYLQQCRRPSSEVVKLFTPGGASVSPQRDTEGLGDVAPATAANKKERQSAPDVWLPLPSTRSPGRETRFRPHEVAPSLYLGALADVSNVLKLRQDLLYPAKSNGTKAAKAVKGTDGAGVAGAAACTTDAPHLLYLVVNACVPTCSASRLELRCVTRVKPDRPPKPGTFAAARPPAAKTRW